MKMLPLMIAVASAMLLSTPAHAQRAVDGDDLLRRAPGAFPTPQTRPDRSETAPAPSNTVVAATGGSCLSRLSAIATAKSVPKPKAKDRACTFREPVRLSAVKTGDGTVALSGKPIVSCEFATQVAMWTREIAAPMAKSRYRKRLTEMGTGPGFQCRRRNRSKRGKLSEHGLGNAIDIVTFKIAGKPIQVQPYRKMKRRDRKYLDAVRKAACGYFTTILGPGSNAAHATHLHFDLGRLYKNGKKRENPYRICD